ncbi:hypothetical protein D6D15_02614 [Aureobasidium pullulans]|uniref:C2H2-type domain-containing protein n=1 Tax=Aureobasidium pullulans TaxID=5580 RepID=A0A4V4IWF9_AURPU|nr:hypothetical protein D6D15_02614 [Aureobasidium pullulans]
MRSCLLLSALAAVSTASIGNGILESNSTTIIDDSDWPATTTDTNSVTRPPFIGPSHILVFPPSSISARPSSSLAKLPASKSTLSRRSDGASDGDQDILVSISGRDLIDDPDDTDDGDNHDDDDHEDGSLLSSASEIGTGIATKVLSAVSEFFLGRSTTKSTSTAESTSTRDSDQDSTGDPDDSDDDDDDDDDESFWETITDGQKSSLKSRGSSKISSLLDPTSTESEQTMFSDWLLPSSSFESTMFGQAAIDTHLNIPHSYSYSHKVKIIQTINHQVKLVQSVSYRVKLISQSNHDHDIDRQLYLCNDSYFHCARCGSTSHSVNDDHPQHHLHGLLAGLTNHIIHSSLLCSVIDIDIVVSSLVCSIVDIFVSSFIRPLVDIIHSSLLCSAIDIDIVVSSLVCPLIQVIFSSSVRPLRDIDEDDDSHGDIDQDEDSHKDNQSSKIHEVNQEQEVYQVINKNVLNAHGFNLHNNHHGLPISITYRLANLVVFKAHDTWYLLHDAWSDEESNPSDLIENENRGSYYTFLYFGGFHSYDFLQNEDRGSCHNHHAFPIIFHRIKTKQKSSTGAKKTKKCSSTRRVSSVPKKPASPETFISRTTVRSPTTTTTTATRVSTSISTSVTTTVSTKFKKGRTTATRWEKTRTKTKTKTPRARTKTIIRPSGVRTEYLLSTKTKMETKVLHHTRTKTRQHTRATTRQHTRTRTTTATTITYIGGVQTKTVTLDVDGPPRPTETVTVVTGRPDGSTRTLSRTGPTVVVSEKPDVTITIPGHSTTITRRPSTASTTVDSSTPGSQTITVSDARVRQIRGMNAGINDRKLGTFKGLGKDRKTVKFPNKHGSDACKAMSKKCKFAAKDDNTVLPCQERLAYEVFQLYEADPNQSFARGEVVACIDQNTNYCASIDWQPWIQKSPKAGKFVEDLMTQRSLNDQDEVPIASVVESMNWMLDSDARLCGETLLTVEKQRHSAGNNLGDMVGRYVLKLGTAPPKKHGPTFEDGSNDHSTDDKDGDDDGESYTPWVKPSGRHFVFPNIHDNSVVSDA